MNVNKKFDRFKQWAGERMGGEAKTNVSDDFKAMEAEMNLRHEGMDKLQRSMTVYVKAMSKRNEGEDREKTLPVGHLGSSMVHHGDDFDPSSEFGQCLTAFGRTQERVARIQESYVASSTSSWLESLDRSLAQMKEYQVSRKKLESRRLAFDASLAKMQKAKKEDFRAEEELRSQKAKYEESSEDVYRRMQDIRESEADSVADLRAFLDAELNYYDRCREVLLQLKDEWPGSQQHPQAGPSRRSGRPRSNTAHSYHERYNPVEEEPPLPSPDSRPTMKSSRASSAYQTESPSREYSPERFQRPTFSRTSTFEGPTQLRREQSPAGSLRLARIPSDNSTLRTTRSQLRVVSKANDPYNSDWQDDGQSYCAQNSPDRYISGGDRSISPTTSNGSMVSRNASSTALSVGAPAGAGKKGPPPPPPSRAKKPPPPPPPAKKYISGTAGM
ncbi:hypothetical protein AJ80_02533 [Polytolypa hystricis UAMH7299]|uniref:BAR domain-containing protein n=1 Tax=Polytolypa hystricis (strain UAMH7299) TaxID=1447883 RepID=A0A2B7YR03_POLH7|nr:hypothetical protein AJ80_02533 [Polytolypa hystricis UAMH7299]